MRARGGARRIVVVERGHLEAAKAFLSTCPGVDMDGLVFVITGVRMGGDPKPEDWLRAGSRGSARISLWPVSRYGE
jgi:hypothetical protein